MGENKIRVITVDDSKIMQELLKKILNSDPEIEVIAAAEDPYVARDLIKRLNPDVITLDIMMPKMDGITFLKNIMRLRPMPVIMVSSLTKEKESIALEALELGAIDYIAKPSQEELNDLSDYSQKLIEFVKEAAKSPIRSRAYQTKSDSASAITLNNIVIESELLRREIIAIGASTGGVEALETILYSLPKVFPPVLVVLHIRNEFISSFAQRINSHCNLVVQKAEDGMAILPGNVYLAPTHVHLLIKNTVEGYACELDDAPPVNGHKPSIDVLFQSIALVAASRGTGILLTGMGRDGAAGLKMIRDIGGATIVQDEKTSVVWGMPSAAIKLDAVDYIVPLPDISQKIMNVMDIKMQRGR